MKTPLLLVLMNFWLLDARGPDQKSYDLSGNYAISIHGTFSIHDWSERIEKVAGELLGSANKDGSAAIQSLRIVMEVRSIRSDMGSVMNKKTYKALKADEAPQITFLLTVPVIIARTGAGERSVPVEGNLTLAGVSRTVTMSIESFTAASETMSIVGVQKIRMTDFGIKPPSALFGTMRASPDITIQFKMDFKIKQQ